MPEEATCSSKSAEFATHAGFRSAQIREHWSSCSNLVSAPRRIALPCKADAALSYPWPRGDPYLCGTQPALLGCMSGISWGAESSRDRKVPCIPISLALFSTPDHTEQSRDAVSPALEPDFESGPSSGPWIMPADPVHPTRLFHPVGNPSTDFMSLQTGSKQSSTTLRL